MLLNKNTTILLINIIITKTVINDDHSETTPESIKNAFVANEIGLDPINIVKKSAM